MLKEKILQLRGAGYTYDQIVKELGCSKGTVSYHCGVGQKEKTLHRTRELRKKYHPFKRKIEGFSTIFISNSKVSSKLSVQKLIQKKIYNFVAKDRKMKYHRYQSPEFTIEDVLDKFGDTPKCYLTGQHIDINKPSTYHFDHIIPRSRGGDNSLDNLGICTKKANEAKGDMTPDEFLNLCKQVISHSE